MTRRKIFNDKCISNHKHTCARCGKKYFTYNIYTNSEIYRLMERKKICWECAYWEKFITLPPDHLEIIGNKCYHNTLLIIT